MNHSGSSPLEQWKKKCLDWKSGSLIAFDMWSILQLVGTTPNVGVEPERRLKRGREVAHRGEERRALLGTPSIHLCQTLL
jgi:hypothetical protein